MPASCAARATFTSGTASGTDAQALDGYVIQTAAEPDHYARHAAIADDEIGA